MSKKKNDDRLPLLVRWFSAYGITERFFKYVFVGLVLLLIIYVVGGL